MGVFDRLPPVLRHALRESPNNWSSTQIELLMHRGWTIDDVLTRMKELDEELAEKRRRRWTGGA